MLNVSSGTLVLLSIIALTVCLCKLVVFIPQFPTCNTKVALKKDIESAQMKFREAKEKAEPREVILAIVNLVDLYNRSGEYEIAEKILKGAIKEKNVDIEQRLILLERLGDIYRNDSRYAEARTSYENAIALNKKLNNSRILVHLKLKVVGLYYHKITGLNTVSLNRYMAYEKAVAELTEIESLLNTFDENKGLRNETANYRLMFSLLAKRYEWNQ